MDAAAAIDELKGLSTQIEAILVAGRDGAVTAATVAGPRAERMGELARDLVGGAVHQLAAGQLFHQVGVGAVLLHQGDAMLKPLAVVLELGQLLLLDAQLRLGILQGQNPAIAPDCIGPEIAYDRQGNGWDHKKAEKSGDGTLDSHAPNESHTESPRQEGFN